VTRTHGGNAGEVVKREALGKVRCDVVADERYRIRFHICDRVVRGTDELTHKPIYGKPAALRVLYVLCLQKIEQNVKIWLHTTQGDGDGNEPWVA
jgi:hypothetical protein